MSKFTVESCFNKNLLHLYYTSIFIHYSMYKIFYFIFFCFVSTDWLKHTILPSFDLWSSGRNCVLRQVQRWLTILQPHEILHGQYSLPHIHAVNGPSSCLYVLNSCYPIIKFISPQI